MFENFNLGVDFSLLASVPEFL